MVGLLAVIESKIPPMMSTGAVVTVLRLVNSGSRDSVFHSKPVKEGNRDNSELCT